MISTTFVPILLISILKKGNASQYTINYEKPVPSNGPCIDSIEMMEELSKFSTLKCLGCYNNAQSSCPSSELKCQELIDNIYRDCDKINLPQRFFFDPPVSVLCVFVQNKHAITIVSQTCLHQSNLCKKSGQQNYRILE